MSSTIHVSLASGQDVGDPGAYARVTSGGQIIGYGPNLTEAVSDTLTAVRDACIERFGAERGQRVFMQAMLKTCAAE